MTVVFDKKYTCLGKFGQQHRFLESKFGFYVHKPRLRRPIFFRFFYVSIHRFNVSPFKVYPFHSVWPESRSDFSLPSGNCCWVENVGSRGRRDGFLAELLMSGQCAIITAKYSSDQRNRSNSIYCVASVIAVPWLSAGILNTAENQPRVNGK